MQTTSSRIGNCRKNQCNNIPQNWNHVSPGLQQCFRKGYTTILCIQGETKSARTPWWSTSGIQDVHDRVRLEQSEVFTDYLKKHFLPALPPRADDEFVLLLYDGHTSHISIPIIEFARAHQIALFVLPAHTSHVTQPLDVACFASLKTSYHKECAKFLQNNPGEMITHYHIARMSAPAYLRSLNSNNLKSAFRKSGICPLDRSAVSMEEVTKTSMLVTPATPTASKPNGKRHQVGPMGDIGDQECSQSEADNFLASRTPTPPEPKEKKRKVTSYYRALGVCITEDRIFMKIICAEEERKKTKAAKGKGKNSKKSSCDASKGESSGKSNRRLFAHPDDSDIEDEDQNPCCVCQQNTPPHPPQMNLEIFSWVACDFQGCNHWVHQKYCSGTNDILGDDDTYNCPCH